MSETLSSRWCKLCVQPEYACDCADPDLMDSVLNKRSRGECSSIEDGVAELRALQAMTPDPKRRRYCGDCESIYVGDDCPCGRPSAI
jgi:hypothetical protein